MPTPASRPLGELISPIEYGEIHAHTIKQLRPFLEWMETLRTVREINAAAEIASTFLSDVRWRPRRDGEES